MSDRLKYKDLISKAMNGNYMIITFLDYRIENLYTWIPSKLCVVWKTLYLYIDRNFLML